MKKEQESKAYRKWRESKEVAKETVSETETQTETSENPFETKAVGVGWTERGDGKGWGWVLFSFEGELERRRYIIGSVGMAICLIIMWIVGIILAFGEIAAAEERQAGEWGLFGIVVIMIMIILSLAAIWPDAAMAAKRLRNMGHESGLAALFVLLPLVPLVGGLGKVGMWIWMMVTDTGEKWTSHYQSTEDSPETEE